MATKLTPNKNVKMVISGDTLTITCKLSGVETHQSASGKSIIFATTSGNIPVPDSDGLVLGLNLYQKA